jgi:hypothetical protein
MICGVVMNKNITVEHSPTDVEEANYYDGDGGA